MTLYISKPKNIYTYLYRNKISRSENKEQTLKGSEIMGEWLISSLYFFTV